VGNLGYVGSVLTTYLNERGTYVRGWDSGYFDPCLLGTPTVPEEQVIGDVREFDKMVLDGIDAIVHLAALSNDPLGELAPGVTEAINVGGLERVVSAAKAAGISRFVFASSCSMYGRVDGTQLLDESAPVNPLTAYARSKAAGEAFLRSAMTPEFRPTALRFSTAYGYSPRLRLDLVVNNLVASGLANGKVVLESDGTPWRPLIHVADMAQAIYLVLTARLESVGGLAFNVGTTTENYQVRDIAATTAEVLGDLPITIGTASGDDRSYNVDFTRFHEAVPFKAEWTMRRGAEDLARSMRENFAPGDFASDRFFRLRRIRSLIQRGTIDEALRFVVTRN